MAEAKKIDPDKKTVLIDDDGSGDVYGAARTIAYDYLIVATGARHSYFKNPEWETLAPGLKSLEDAREVRRRFLLAFENAEKTDDPKEREAWQMFIIVGGGPTGVELSGVIPEIARKALPNNFRRIDTKKTRVILVEGGKRILPQFPEELSARALKDLMELGVEIWTDAMVTDITKEGVTVGGEFVPAKTVFWGAGNQASPLGKDLGAERDKAGRIIVNDDLSVPNRPEIFVIGDLANFYQDKNNNKSVPWVAQGAIQGGQCAAKNILRRIKGEKTEAFSYWNKGDMAVIGRNRAIAHIGNAKIGGFVAWILWAFIHVLYLASFRNRVAVAMEWAYAYLTFERGARLLSFQEATSQRNTTS